MACSMIRLFVLTVLLLATSSPCAGADAAEASTVTVEEEPIFETQSLRQRRGQDERRLFAWGNLLYALHVCSGNGSGWCPAPHCDGPLKPPSCKHNSGGSGGSTSGGSSSSSSSSGNAVYASDGEYSNNNAGNEAKYAEETETIESAYNYESDNSGQRVSDGVSSSSGTKGVQRRTNFLFYLLAAAAVASVVGVYLMKKKSRDLEEEEVEHQLSQSVSKRLEKLLAGKGVPPINVEAAGPSFVALKDSNTPKLADVLPKTQNLAEPDEEAIEINLDTRNLTNNYVKMA